jgi:flagellar biosynthesis protein FlhG
MQNQTRRPGRSPDEQSIDMKRRRPARGVTRVMSFTSGKGGVGKTNSVVNFAVALGRLGRKVLILDADLGLANIDVLLGIKAQYTLYDVLEGSKLLEEIILDGPDNVSIIPSVSGVQSICSLSGHQRLALIQAIEGAAYDFDYLLIDTQAGIGSEVMYFNSASSEVVCVINAEPTSLTDAYALIKVLSREYGEKSITVLANNVTDEAAGRGAFNRLCRSAQRFLQVELKYLGCVPTDPAVRAAVTEQRALLEVFPSSPAALAFGSLARSLDQDFHELRVKGGMQFFFKQLLEVSAYGR